MNLPFSRPEFLQVFSDFNQSIWPLQWITAALGVLAVGLLVSGQAWKHRAIASILSAFWLITGAGYHWLFFARINPAAYLFGSLFVIAALLFLIEGIARGRIRFRLPRGVSGWMPLALMGYALVLYPVVGLAATHPYPETPLFGVAPCPTTIFTLALLTGAYHPRPMLLAAVPLLWAVVGGSAAILLDMPQDWGLIAGGFVWVIEWIRRRSGSHSA